MEMLLELTIIVLMFLDFLIGFMAPLYKQEKKNAVIQLANMNYTYLDWNCLNNDSMKKYTATRIIR